MNSTNRPPLLSSKRYGGHWLLCGWSVSGDPANGTKSSTTWGVRLPMTLGIIAGRGHRDGMGNTGDMGPRGGPLGSARLRLRYGLDPTSNGR